LSYRISGHFADAKKKNTNGKFQKALRKYGRDGFVWGIVEECDLLELNTKEIYWIAKYKTVENGYNLSSGGGQPPEYYCKEYLIETPDGERRIIKNLSEYCRNHDLNVGHLHETLCGKRVQHKGCRLIPRTEDEIKKCQEERKIREDTSRKSLPGDRNGRAILNWQKVKQIREMHSSKKYKNQEIADMFKIKKVTLEKIVANKLWAV